MARIHHQQIALSLGLIKREVEQHLYTPKSLLQNERHKLYWDVTMVTERGVAHNRPDVVIFDVARAACLLIDITIPADENLSKAYREKITKYADLAFQLRELHELESISVMPLVMSVDGLVEEHLVANTEKLGLDRSIISAAQKQVILGTVRTVRRFLQGPS